jgi:hypothetical protein
MTEKQYDNYLPYLERFDIINDAFTKFYSENLSTQTPDRLTALLCITIMDSFYKLDCTLDTIENKLN